MAKRTFRIETLRRGAKPIRRRAMDMACFLLEM
ncbi:hypothetical protein RB2654_08497 [Rhodobacterales bacterium HTCC2654]|uniref:Uncharacterized protein n=1 Tax=Maritimibacter alkaliphilus HTCC2654 TaxID=314271 RepID=A3VHP0_9RHOB|nr:hypothetical protein RB2654_08497 [Rhodobacterales bacterium HTCC2654] [Maritimibacter alkaliphilus HTCC2654]